MHTKWNHRNAQQRVTKFFINVSKNAEQVMTLLLVYIWFRNIHFANLYIWKSELGGGGGKEGGEDTAGWMCAQIPHTQTQRHRCTYHSFRAVCSSSTGSWWQGGIRTVVTSWTQWTHWRSCTAVCTWSQSGKYVMYYHHELCTMVVVAFSLLARVLEECLTIHSPPALLFFLSGD